MYLETESSDITLALKDSVKPYQSICKFNKNGFCKFGEKCTKMHVNTLCNTINCNKNACRDRHPKSCKYFSQNGYCRFGKDCAFNHKNSIAQTKVVEMEIEVNNLKTEVEFLKNKITESENEIFKREIEDLKVVVFRNYEYIVALQNHIRKNEDQFVCDICGYEASSKTVLKSHATRNHKKEMLREADNEETKDLNISYDLDEHENSIVTSNNHLSTASYSANPCCTQDSFHAHSHIALTSPSDGKCYHCKNVFSTESELATHMISEHKSTHDNECFACGDVVQDGVNGKFQISWGHFLGGHVEPACYTCLE